MESSHIGMAFGVYICCDASSSYAMEDEVEGNDGAMVDVYPALEHGTELLTSKSVICDGIPPDQCEGSAGIQSRVTFCGIKSSSGISGAACAGAADV